MSRALVAAAIVCAAVLAMPATTQVGLTSPPTGAQLEALALLVKQPGKPITSLPFTIDTCGRYYLTRCLTASGTTDGITVAADDVTIDLNGFTLYGGTDAVTTTSLTGIVITGNTRNLAIEDGYVRFWGEQGIDLRGADGVRVERVHSTDNADHGLLTERNAIVSDCIFARNGGRGMRAEINTITRGTVFDQNAQAGFEGIASTNLVSESVARGNGSHGIYGGQDALADECVTVDNGGIGVHGSHVAECVSKTNAGGNHGGTSSDSSL